MRLYVPVCMRGGGYVWLGGGGACVNECTVLYKDVYYFVSVYKLHYL